MESDDLRALARVAERGEAAPWLSQPAPRWWQAPAIGLVVGLYTLLTAMPQLTHGFTGVGVLVVLAITPYRRWLRGRRGIDPSGARPVELDRLRTRLVAGVVVLGVVWFLLVTSFPGWASATTIAVIVTAFVQWYLRSEAAAVARLRARLL